MSAKGAEKAKRAEREYIYRKKEKKKRLENILKNDRIPAERA
jgi:hypothetical protein